MRITKSVEERRTEILDVASRLFMIKGYDETSTNDILDEIGIARGTLYYHFKSKEAILDAVIMRMVDNMLAEAREIANNRDIPLLDRISGVIKALNAESKLGKEVTNQMHKPQNALLHQKVSDLLIDGVVPIITDIFEECIDMGIFKTVYARECAEMIMIYSNIVFDDRKMTSPEENTRRIEGFIYNIERMLGTKRGYLREVITGIFR